MFPGREPTGDELDAVDEALDDDRFFDLSQDVFADLHVVLQGRVFAHRLTQEEIDAGALPVEPTLEAVTWSFAVEVPLADGGTADLEFSEDGDAIVVGPPGWLSGRSAGDLLAFSLRDGALAVEPVWKTEGAGPVVALSQAMEARAGGPDRSALLVEILVAAAIRVPEAFRAGDPPLAEVLEAAGIERRGEWVGRAGSGWRTPPEEFARTMRRAREEIYGFSACCHSAYDEVMIAWRARGDEAPGRPVATALAHGQVAEAFARHELAQGGRAAELETFALGVAEAGTGRDPAAAHYVRALALEWDHRTGDCEAALRDAVAADPGFPPALEELAWFAEDRGDATGAMDLLTRAGSELTPYERERLADLAARSRRKVGRNEPCPCGSGRKSKACCDGRVGLPLAERADWLYDKALAFVRRPRQRGEVAVLAEIAADAAGTDDESEFAFDTFVAGLVLFEGGILSDFVEVRGSLLPEDEWALAEAWAHLPLRLYEIVSTEGVEAEIRDCRTGDRSRIVAQVDDADLETGALLLGRVGPVGDRLDGFVGPALDAPLRLRDGLLEMTGGEPGAEDWAAWYGSTQRPPVFRNMEGHDILACEARYAVVRPQATRDALAAVLDEDPSTPGRFSRTGKAQGQDWLRFWVAFSGDELVVQAGSAERFEEARAVVEAAVPGLTLLSERRLTPGEASASAEDPLGEAADVTASPVPEPEALGDLMRQFAERWVGEEVPALGGLTPRQALDDPTRREDLMALLREMKSEEGSLPGTAMGMPTGYVRQLLGLPADG